MTHHHQVTRLGHVDEKLVIPRGPPKAVRKNRPQGPGGTFQKRCPGVIRLRQRSSTLSASLLRPRTSTLCPPRIQPSYIFARPCTTPIRSRRHVNTASHRCVRDVLCYCFWHPMPASRCTGLCRLSMYLLVCPFVRRKDVYARLDAATPLLTIYSVIDRSAAKVTTA